LSNTPSSNYGTYIHTINNSVTVIVSQINAHTAFWQAEFLVRDTRGQGAVSERKTGGAQVEIIGTGVVGDVEIDPAIAIDIGRDDPQRPAIAAQRGLFCSIPEFAIAAIE